MSDDYEVRELSALPRLLEGCDYFVDVGANVGVYVSRAARSLSGATILAIEPNPALAAPLHALVAQLGREGLENNYEVVSAAICDSPGTVDFFISPSSTLSSLFPGGGERLSVPARRLDDFFRPFRRAFVKVDVEGAEYRVVKSAGCFLEAGAPFLVELHGWGDRERRKYPIDVCGIFLRHGYAVRRIGSHFLFYRASPVTRIMSHMLVLPWTLPKSLVYRYVPRLGPYLRAARTMLERRLGRFRKSRGAA